MINLPEQFAARRVVISVPDHPLRETVGPVEVLVQESLDVLSLPVRGQFELAQLRAMYAARATIGVHGVASLADAQWAVENQAAFAFAAADAEVIATLQDAGVPAIVAALTPTEVTHVAALGPAGVQVEPAGVLGTDYPGVLAELVAGTPLVPAYAETDQLITAWLDAGAAAICIRSRLMDAMFGWSGLAVLRDRCAELVTLVSRYRSVKPV